MIKKRKMKEQKALELETRTKQERIEQLKKKYFSNFSKIISEFGNLNSKILILGISPVLTHYSSSSHACFAFDINTNQTEKSGGILCKTLQKLSFIPEELLFDNIYKVPENNLTYYTKKLSYEYMQSFIKIIQPKIIVCLGNDTETVVNKLQINDNIVVKKCLHPGAHLRGFYTFEEYLRNWQRLNLREYVK